MPAEPEDERIDVKAHYSGGGGDKCQSPGQKRPFKDRGKSLIMEKNVMREAGNSKESHDDSFGLLENIGYSSLIITAIIIMTTAIIYVWSHNRMTTLEYRVAAEVNKQEELLEEQRRLKVELATLKSPKRIASIAANKLDMIYPAREQIIFLKDKEHTETQE
jgi:cell division protein FtsL